MMRTRGIIYHTLDDIKKVAYRTIQANKMQNMDIKNLISKIQNVGVATIRKTTTRSSLFIGDFDIVFVSQQGVESFFKIQHLREMLEDPMITDKYVIEQEIDSLRDLIFSENYTEKDFYLKPSYVIIFKHGESDSPIWVGTSYPEPIMNLISDSRFYELDDGQVLISEDGIPLSIYYKDLDNGDVVYSKTKGIGFKHVGE